MLFSIPQKVLFKHCDPAGLVFYPRYFEMINDLIETFFDQIGYPFETLHDAYAVPTVQIDVAFPAPSRHGDHLELALQIDRLGTTSVTFEFRATANDSLRFEGTSTLVHITKDGQPTPWPATTRTAFTPYIRSTA